MKQSTFQAKIQLFSAMEKEIYDLIEYVPVIFTKENVLFLTNFIPNIHTVKLCFQTITLQYKIPFDFVKRPNLTSSQIIYILSKFLDEEIDLGCYELYYSKYSEQIYIFTPEFDYCFDIYDFFEEFSGHTREVIEGMLTEVLDL